jgi:4-hydroxy-tetrahydrodipicolinate synthase
MVTIAATGCASLSDTLILTRFAFEAGADAVLVIPPFYYKNPHLEGLVTYYRAILEEAVPKNGTLLLYHIPQVTQVPISMELVERLMEAAPGKLAGIKDSGGDLVYQRELCESFPMLQIFAGSDSHLLESLRFGSAGCITACANVLAPLNVAVYNAFMQNQSEADALQERLTAARAVLEKYMPFPPAIKYLLSYRYGTSGWEPRAPLVPLKPAEQTNLLGDLKATDLSN